MKISVVIPTKDRSVDLVRAVQSVLKQKRRPDELLIIDQGVNSKSKDAIKQLFDQIDYGFKLIYVHDSAIAGLVAAKAAAVALSSGNIIMFLEDDVILEEEYILNMAQGFADRPAMMGACGVISEVAGTGVLYRCLFHLFHRGIFHDKRVNIHGHLEGMGNQFIQSDYLSGGVSAYRSTVFDCVKFDTQNGFFMLEDIDFSTRAAREFGSGRFFINTSARLAHLMSPVNRMRLGPRYQRKLREFICFYKKNRHRSGALANLLWLLVGLATEAIVISIKLRHFGPVSGFVRGVIDGIRWQIKPIDMVSPLTKNSRV
jgi:glycosyltransferase involved in cell wall biosynthesis